MGHKVPLWVDLHPGIMKILRRICYDRGITMTEAVNRSIIHFDLALKRQAAGERLTEVDSEGRVVKVHRIL